MWEETLYYYLTNGSRKNAIVRIHRKTFYTPLADKQQCGCLDLIFQWMTDLSPFVVQLSTSDFVEVATSYQFSTYLD